ncbi:uncharacterized protein UV8b_06722 [Ustilaginoidea virens]|uniref:Probable dipeptidyl-aminopeptidase B n=1 Tax=Ustilaginoidea virens TaxID=1159556 RepID=A0A1B5L4E7_USTVR|nr:uncharacterized protein UV8b_06722 [Ustilaginoidea virens]QUC22481.1 hypothetical protein UV8b_06722 [Ustilaginoidea virens]GAO18360.1 hypothetical protein UVI_02044040 [Ustilaginoidea virens]
MAPFTHHPDGPASPEPGRPSHDSLSSVSTTSLVFDRLQEEVEKHPSARRTSARSRLPPRVKDEGEYDDSETGPFLGEPETAPGREPKPMDRSLRRILVAASAVFVTAWLAALGVFLATASYKHARGSEHNRSAYAERQGKAVTLDQILTGYWYAASHDISWIADPDGDDGLLLQRNAADGYLVAEDVRAHGDRAGAGAGTHESSGTTLAKSRTLMKTPHFTYNGDVKIPEWSEPSPDLKKVLLAVNWKKNWRHSFTATYFVLDVESGKAEPLVPRDPNATVQLADWSPRSDAVSFTMDNNLYLRRLTGSRDVVQITQDGGPEYFYGIPDWVYEEEVFSGRSATWWSKDGNYLAFLRTNETAVPEYAVEYYLQRPSGERPAPGEEAYPDVRKIKYPKPGAHNPVVDILYHDVSKGGVFSVTAPGAFGDDNRIVSNVLWAGREVLVKQLNRVGDHLQVILVDPSRRQAKIVNDVNIGDVDGGWFEISHAMTYVPADAGNGRRHDGYVDTVVHDGYEHIGYFTPMDNPKPVMLTSGPWEVEDGPSAVDVVNNLVYFVAARESAIQRHVYSVKLDGSALTPLTDTSQEGYFRASFSSGAGFALLSYQGPGIPYQRVVSTPSGPARYNRTVEDNKSLADKAAGHQLPLLEHGSLQLDTGVSVNYLERRPPGFTPRNRYPVLFHQYSGPGSQSVTKRFAVDFQSYVASALGYLVVTVDPRGTGFRGRQHRVAVRSKLGVLEAEDHIAAARHYASLAYVDPSRIALWGWSYGGFQTLKTLERDAGNTFSYGMAVAPVTDWRFYDSIYTERYMRLPRDNAAGYDASAIANATALGCSKRFLIMHGSADDNVHFQNSLKLLDSLDLQAVENYDVHVFPDSDHSISFHRANRMVYQRLNNWLINAFNGEWLKTAHPKPVDTKRRRGQ